MRRSVVKSLKKDVANKDFVVGFFQMIIDSLKNFFDGVGFGDGHETFAFF